MPSSDRAPGAAYNPMLDKRRRQKLLELFAEAVERAPGTRAAFVEQRCAGDAELRTELDSMLEVPTEQVERFLDEPVTRLIADAAEDCDT